MTTEQIHDARAWCADVWADYDPDASDAYVLRAVQHHYHGGVAGFLADGGYQAERDGLAIRIREGN